MRETGPGAPDEGPGHLRLGDPQYGRTADQHLALWQHFAAFGGEDKNRMVVVASWLLGFSAAMAWYFVAQGDNRPQGASAVLISVLGIGVSVTAGYVVVLYGGYANHNWQQADEIARGRGWIDLLPSHEGSTKPTGKLNALALRWAAPREPTAHQAPIFVVFLTLSAALFIAHTLVLCWSTLRMR